ncbi:hypothetical protein OSJ77_03290 [Phyllobacterium sp. 0TCS1.6C]|uniref:hypothetical protein n=1 Tax=unclassified Phyllobacterium TaxID=2638441 RepID=UPI002263B8E8|nr:MULTISPECIES: hypothetical protein [unclassified Phyllobacterium]MCX8279199.1 hypothetical protein [Phyllobacterium sp. 0TCS1.6C]MCX8293983.1 hypothetical protein [Phyllobacterium sp. 0TCS1.6A]
MANDADRLDLRATQVLEWQRCDQIATTLGDDRMAFAPLEPNSWGEADPLS